MAHASHDHGRVGSGDPTSYRTGGSRMATPVASRTGDGREGRSGRGLGWRWSLSRLARKGGATHGVRIAEPPSAHRGPAAARLLTHTRDGRSGTCSTFLLGWPWRVYPCWYVGN